MVKNNICYKLLKLETKKLLKNFFFKWIGYRYVMNIHEKMSFPSYSITGSRWRNIWEILKNNSMHLKYKCWLGMACVRRDLVVSVK